MWDYHNEWTEEFFAELDRRGDPGRFDRSKAAVIMDLLKRQLLSPRYIQHSARVLFVVGQANQQQRAQILEAIFDLSREEIVKRVEAGTLSRSRWPPTTMSMTSSREWNESSAGRHEAEKSPTSR